MSPASAVSRSALLPPQPTPLVGREGELTTIHQLLSVEGARLLTLVGPAGVGKTRLALAAATQLAGDADRFPDGVVWMDLTPIRDPDLVLGAIAHGLGLLDMSGRPVQERLVEALAEQRQLVVLDNFEQALAAGADLATLLTACPDLTLFVTSRVPLRLRWEQLVRVAPLPVPNLRIALPSLDALLAVPSVALFVERARTHRADFVLSEREAPLVAELAAELDGLPLALELAAARLGVLSLPALTRRLGDRLRLLASAAPDRPARQRSLEAAIGWSYDLLTLHEQQLFRCLGVFAGRVSLDAVASVAADVAQVRAKAETVGDERDAAGGDGGRTLEELLSLAEQSLILPARPAGPAWQRQWSYTMPAQGLGEEVADDEEEDAEPTFGVLETMREFAEERLAAAGELEAARHAHAHYFLAFAERADPQLRGRDQRSWYFRLEREHDNLRAALRWLLDQDSPEEREIALRLTAALGYFWFVRGYHAEGQRWLDEALARAPQEGDVEREGAEESTRTWALLFAGLLLTLTGEVARARAPLEAAAALTEWRRDSEAMAQVLTHLGLCAVFAGEVVEANRLLHEALRRWEVLDNAAGLGLTLFYLGRAADAAGDAAAAGIHYQEALGPSSAVGDAHLTGFVHCFLGVSEWRRGELPDAVEHIRAAVRTSISLQNRVLLGVAAQATVALTGADTDPAGLARLLGALDALVRATGAPVAWKRMPGGQDVVGLRERLARGEEGEESATAFREGQSLHSGAMAAFTLDLLEEVSQKLAEPQGEGTQVLQAAQPAQRSTGQPVSPLSPRETAVLRLVAEGLSSKEIGRRLFIAPSTVNYHLTSIFNKLGVDTRAQAVAVAARRNLL